MKLDVTTNNWLYADTALKWLNLNRKDYER